MSDDERIRAFAKAILHGDDEHREWLTEAAEAFIAGTPLPPPRGKGTNPPKEVSAFALHDRVKHLSLAQKERDAKTMRHLGNVLQLLAELHPDDRCRALDSALEFFNRENPHAQIEPAEGHVSRLVIDGPLQHAIRN